MKSAWHHIEAWFKKLFGSTKWEKTASSVLTYIAPLLETIVALVAGQPVEAAVAAIVAEIQGDLAAASALIANANVLGVSPVAGAINLLNSVKANLAELLAAAQVKDTAVQQKITAIANSIIGEVEAILAAIPASSS
jgi:Flp pilus assembly protein TadB